MHQQPGKVRCGHSDRPFDILARVAAMALIREEIPDDYDAVREVNQIAFGGTMKQR
jgi:hypothetical protein